MGVAVLLSLLLFAQTRPLHAAQSRRPSTAPNGRRSAAPSGTPSRPPSAAALTDIPTALPTVNTSAHGDANTCFYDSNPWYIFPDIMCPYGSFVNEFIVCVSYSDTSIQSIRVYCSNGFFAGMVGQCDYGYVTVSYSVMSNRGFKRLSGYSDVFRTYILQIDDDRFGSGIPDGSQIPQWSCECGENQVVRGLLRPTGRFINSPTGFELYCDTPCPAGSGFAASSQFRNANLGSFVGSEGVNSPSYALITDGAFVDYGGECLSISPTRVPTSSQPIIRTGVEVTCFAVNRSPELVFQSDIMCPYGTFVSRFRIGLALSRIREIGIYCSDGSFAGSFGADSTSYVSVNVASGTSFVSGRYGSGTSGDRYETYLDSLLVGGGWYGIINNRNASAEWTCACGFGKLMRGIRSPVLRYDWPYGFQLFCDTPCASGFFGRDMSTLGSNSSVAEYGGVCNWCPTQQKSGQTSCASATAAPTPGKKSVFSIPSNVPDPATLIVIIVVVVAGACIIGTILLVCFKCFCVTQVPPTPVPAVLYLAATTQEGPAIPSAPPLQSDLQDDANASRV